ncbi:phosphotransferase [Cyanobacterium aponinum UTEX 3222]|uniref:phosphotransferase n=1 Tax=Cyanobacterium aponinum TaxID=379064 RepID=UPI003087EB42|nr:phosphotransferase [Cyanobacterium aponinum UTEX 3222]
MNCTIINNYQIHPKDKLINHIKNAINPHQVIKIFSENISIIQEDNYKLIKIELIRYKPQKRCLIEYHFQGKNNLILIGKIRAKKIDFHSFQLQKNLWQNGFDENSQDNISVPEVVGIVTQWQMWLQKKVSGQILSQYLTKNQPIKIYQKVAHIAHKLHKTNIPINRNHTIKNELDILHEKLPLLTKYYPHWQKRIENLLNQCDILASKVIETELCGIHRDFYFDQIIIDNNRFYLLDLDLYCRGNPCLDIGNFIGHISEYSLRQFEDIFALKYQELALKNEFINIHKREKQDHLSLSELKDLKTIINNNIDIYSLLTLVRHIYLSTQFIERHTYTKKLFDFCEEKIKLALTFSLSSSL